MLTDSGRKTGRCIIRSLRNDKGSVLLEFVMVITVLTVIFMAAVTFSFLFSDYYGVQKVAREGAREASVTGNTDWAGAKALQAAWLWGLDPEKISVEFSRDGTAVTCYVTYSAAPFHKTFPVLVGGVPLKDVAMNARATFVWSESR